MSFNPPEIASGATTLARPDCKSCGGTGWKRVSEQRHGRAVESAARCECVHGQKIDRLLKQARVPARYEHCELSNFEHQGSFKSLASAHMAARKFVEEYPVESAGLLIIGPIGVGKTHLAVGIMKELMTKKGVQCLFYDYRELLKEIQNSWNPQVQVTEMEVLTKVFEAEVLVLDELGAVRPSEWVWDTVSHILNTRYNDKRTTIITTNYLDQPPGGTAVRSTDGRQRTEETLGDRIGERMRSRLHEMCRVVNVQGDDFRMKYQSHSPR
ncbi:MAG TPA: ATP-binding protein [candidate division Zixibacteria bacterium]|nr:ATP-binding protein [candidate division Zixibacteria bacterium]